VVKFITIGVAFATFQSLPVLFAYEELYLSACTVKESLSPVNVFTS
jgi:hypothetical protein